VKHRSWKSCISRAGLVSIVINIALLLIAHFVPSALGDIRQGELSNTRIELVVMCMNYPVFWVLANAPPKNWSANSFDVGLMFLAMAAYWYSEGLLAVVIVRKLQGIWTRWIKSGTAAAVGPKSRGNGGAFRL
jgi:hypothetical protein